jgi:fluoroquinolone transport system permease protein
MQAFMLLDERDDDVLVAVRTSPMPLATFVGFRVATTTVFGMLLLILMVPVMGLSSIAPLDLILVGIGAAPIGPLFALFINLLANNTVAGFAVVKGTGLLLLIPVIAIFIPAPWHLFMGIVPLYWPVMAFAQATGAANAVLPVWALAGIGFVYQTALTVLVFRRFRAKLDRGA